MASLSDPVKRLTPMPAQFEGPVRPPVRPLTDLGPDFATARRGIAAERAAAAGVGSGIPAAATTEAAAAPRASTFLGKLRGFGSEASRAVASKADGMRASTLGRAAPLLRGAGTAALAAGVAEPIVRAVAPIGGAMANAVGRMAGLSEQDIADADRRLGGGVGVAAGNMVRDTLAVPAQLFKDPSPTPTTPSGVIGRGSFSRGFRSPVESGSIPSSMPAAAPAATLAEMPDNRSEYQRSLGTGTITNNQTGVTTRLGGSTEISPGARAVLAAWGPQETRGTLRNPGGAFEKIAAQNNARYEDRRERAWAELGIRAQTAGAQYKLGLARLRADVDDKTATRLEQSIDKWSTTPDPKDPAKSFVDPTMRAKLSTFLSEAMTDKNGALSQQLAANPLVLERTMPHIVRALRQTDDVNALARDPGFLRSLTNFVGLTTPALTTEGDFSISGTRKARFSDAVFGGSGVDFGDWAAGSPVAQTDTGAVLRTKDLTNHSVQDMRDFLRRGGK